MAPKGGSAEPPPPYKSQSRLAKHLGFANVNLYYGWLESDLFRPYYLDLLEATTSTTENVNSVKAIQQALAHGSRSGRGIFIGKRPKKDRYRLVDHYASCMKDLLEENTHVLDGIFFGKVMTEDEQFEALWQVILRCNWQNCKSKKDRNSRESLIFGLRGPTDKEQAGAKKTKKQAATKRSAARDTEKAVKAETKRQQKEATSKTVKEIVAWMKYKKNRDAQSGTGNVSPGGTILVPPTTTPNATKLPRAEPSHRLNLAYAHVEPDGVTGLSLEEARELYPDKKADAPIGDDDNNGQDENAERFRAMDPLERVKATCEEDLDPEAIDFSQDLHKFKFMQDVMYANATENQKSTRSPLQFDHEAFQAAEWQAEAMRSDDDTLTQVTPPDAESTRKWIYNNQQLDSINTNATT